MRCRDADKHIESYLDGTLDSHIRRAFDEHLKTCALCHDMMNRRHRLIALFQPVPAPPFPENLTRHIMAGVEQIVRGSQPETATVLRPSPLPALFSMLMKPAVAAALALGLALGFYMARDMLPKASGNMTASATTAQTDAFVAFNLDNLTDSPSGSLPDVYLSVLTGQAEGDR